MSILKKTIEMFVPLEFIEGNNLKKMKVDKWIFGFLLMIEN